MKKYISSHPTPKRESLYKSLQSKEYHYKDNIPPKAVGRTLNKHGMRAEYDFTDKSETFYTIKDKQGNSHGRIGYNKKIEKVNWWYIK
jgi:hypothetical protein